VAKAFLRSIRSTKRKLALADLSKIADKEIRQAMDKKVKPALIKSFENVVANWKSDVGFAARTYVRRDSITVYVFPTGKDKMIWIYVDQGTKPHPIFPKKPGGVLAFQGGTYVPKTLAKPARTVYGGGTVKNPKPVFAKSVQHPGSEARGFTKQIAKDIQPEFKREVENAFRRAARKANGK